MSCRQSSAEPELYCVHKIDEIEGGDENRRAMLHNEQQRETGKGRNIPPQAYVHGNVQCLLSVHVDDIKGNTRKGIAESLLAHLNETVGRCNADCSSFLHACIQHEHAAGVVFTHQYVYIYIYIYRFNDTYP